MNHSERLREMSDELAAMADELKPVAGNGEGGDFPAAPPDVLSGMERHWELSQVSDVSKRYWNSLGVHNAIVMPGEKTGMFSPVQQMKFNVDGILESKYPGFARRASWQNVNYMWAPVGEDNIFHPYPNNDTDNPKSRSLKLGVLYCFGFDFQMSGLNQKNPPNRITLWKTKPQFKNADGPNDYAGIDSCPTIGCSRINGKGTHRLKVLLMADSDLHTPDVSDLEINEMWAGPEILDDVVYRVQFNILYAADSQGLFKVTLRPAGQDMAKTKVVVDEPNITTWLKTDVEMYGHLMAARAPYFGNYITGSGTGRDPVTCRMSNIYCDVGK